MNCQYMCRVPVKDVGDPAQKDGKGERSFPDKAKSKPESYTGAVGGASNSHAVKYDEGLCSVG